ncbi:MAG: VWA domain-containing protein [Rhodoferax sp.]|uniref:VWA domain-containing protein n=1 Tax=Rhodoferax sp. TaxID=50421 RepID=UPI003BB6D4D0
MPASDLAARLPTPLPPLKPYSSLLPYLRALWGANPQLAVLGPAPGEADVPPRAILSGRSPQGQTLHLPVHAEFMHPPPVGLAIASHAAAHWHFGGPPVPRGHLKPVQQALLGVLEDARVEWWALQALPGLRELWLPFHVGENAARGNGFEALLGRLAHSLLDPSHVDAHPWVAKARAVFFAPDGQTLALRTAQEVRQAASLLGHDIGQMRLPFNARTYRVHAAYRDDNSYLWLADPDLPPSDTPLQSDLGVSAQPDDASTPPLDLPANPMGSPGSGLAPPLEQPDTPVAVYPEWDHRISRYRTAWCQVYAAPRLPTPASTPPASLPRRVPERLVQALAGLRGDAVRTGGRAYEGEDIHPGALVDVGIDLRLHQLPDPRIYRRVWRPPPPLAVLLLLDASASTGRAAADGQLTLRDQISAAAGDALAALETLGHRTALWSFSSWGRQRIDMPCLKHWDEPASAHRLSTLGCGGSSRMGAAVRHGLALLAADAARQPRWKRVLLLVTDGELHDIDVHDQAYLPADLRRAAQEARQQKVSLRCLAVPPGDTRVLTQLLGSGSGGLVRNLAELPQRLAGLLASVDGR